MNKTTLFLNGLLVIGLLSYNSTQAQNKEIKEVKTSIMIMNGDTIVNGKKFSQLPESEKVELRKSFKGLNSGQLRISRNTPHDNAPKVIIVNTDGVDAVLTDGSLTQGSANAQNKRIKEIRTSVMIMDDDSIMNWKKFSELPESEKMELRKNSKGLNSSQLRISNNAQHGNVSKVIIVNSDGKDSILTDGTNQRVFNFNDGSQRMHIQVETDSESNDMDGQNIERKVIIRKNGMNDMGLYMGDSENGISAPQILQRMTEGTNMDFARPNKPNSSRFNYSFTDKDGYTTRTQISILEPNKADLKDVLKSENLAINTLAVDDLVLSPNYSSGKITVSFTTTAKGVLAVKLVDTDGDILFSENKAIFDNSYTKQFALAKNGIYFLEVSQAGKTYVRKLIKN